ncbi:sensor histidine kinase [Viridibacterium curvum]|uniref:histidine kinase n=1 Tax=Viridibacterium curvum TaxID=1101404 RepID=A0ABP9QTU8_9RHOO
MSEPSLPLRRSTLGLLFVRLFLILLAAQLLAVLGVSFMFSLQSHKREDFQRGILSLPGMPPPMFDNDGRPVFRGPPPGAPGRPPHDAGPPGGPSDEPGFSFLPRIPFVPVLSGVVVSFLFAALLAWYIAKPVRRMQQAFAALSHGDLSVRLGEGMGRGRDELALLSRDFDSMAAQLQALVDGQRRLFHDISHELRSPLARIQAAIGLARQQPERAEQTLQRIERESVRMDKLIAELLTLARLEAGGQTLQGSPVVLIELLTDLVEDAQLEAAARSCRVSMEPGVPVQVQGDAELLRSAMENIVRNAVKHAPQGSVVRIDLQFGAAGWVDVTVTDQGRGVPPEALTAIFKPFFRSGAQGGDGHGLGLAITQRIIAMHGGKVWAENLREGGFAVHVSLPELRIAAP